MKEVYTHLRWKNGAVAVFLRTEGIVGTKEAIEQEDKHPAPAVIILYRNTHDDYHKMVNGSWKSMKDSEVPEQVKEYIRLTAE